MGLTLTSRLLFSDVAGTHSRTLVTTPRDVTADLRPGFLWLDRREDCLGQAFQQFSRVPHARDLRRP